MKKKLLMISGSLLCALVLIAGSVMGTIAFLTSEATVTNTFTVGGNIQITLTESKVDLNGQLDGTGRVTENKYHLTPGTTYIKDPLITVNANSDACYIFVQIKNGLHDFTENDGVAQEKRIGEQLAALGWEALTANNAEGVYVHLVSTETVNDGEGGTKEQKNYIQPKSNEAATIQVFNTFTISSSANLSGLELNSDGTLKAQITVTAYAVQATGFDNPADAWNATFGASKN